MPSKKLESSKEQGHIQFTIESRILKELGERLVSDASVALTELIKNAYDADASECKVTVSDDKIIVSDNGLGMTFNDFKTRWMTIATSNKAKNSVSKKYKRKLTGSKGIGRFAVRFLGQYLQLESVSEEAPGKRKKLIAIFDWVSLDGQSDILDLQVPYSLEDTTEKCGTTLTVTDLRESIDQDKLKSIKSGILEITSPIYAFVTDASKQIKNSTLKELIPSNIESEFNVIFSGLAESKSPSNEKNLPATVLENYVLRATLSIVGKKLTVSIHHQNPIAKPIEPFEINIHNYIGSDVYADIRFFPRRGGVFLNKGIDGFKAWEWVRENHGVKVFDHGFGIKPYGHIDDDWLWLDSDGAHNRRDWRSDLMEKYFPMDPEDAKSPKRNPMVGLPTNYQTIGAVFVKSSASENDVNVLIPSMDRQGYVENAAFKQLRRLIRFTVELIAHHDKKIIQEVEKHAREEKYAQQRDEIDAVVSEIRSSATLSLGDKERIIEHYVKIKDDIEKLDEYDKAAREGLEVMSLLGVVAGFMTHEYQAALMSLENAAKLLRSLSDKDKKFSEYATEIDKSIANFTGYIEYTRLFVSNLHLSDVKPYKALPTVKHVTQTFKLFQEERQVEVDLSGIEANLQAPLIPVAMYQGIVHNLYTNALKVLLNEQMTEKTILIQAWNEPKKHILQVIDNGPGVPDDVKNRIWDPLYTTTSAENNPLGSGMGLGLPLVKKVVEGKKGKVSLVKPPPGYSTCFRVEIPLGE